MQFPRRLPGIRWSPRYAARVSDAPLLRRCFHSIAAMFQAAHNCDYYITKYQSKVMDALAPLFKSLLPGIQRLAAEQEKEDAAEEVEAMPEGKAKEAAEREQRAEAARKEHDALQKQREAEKFQKEQEIVRI